MLDLLLIAANHIEEKLEQNAFSDELQTHSLLCKLHESLRILDIFHILSNVFLDSGHLFLKL